MRIAPGLFIGAATVCCAAAISSFAWRAALPFKGYQESKRVVVIEPGRPARAAADTLREAGVIRSALAFRILMRLRGAGGKIHAGEYEFTGQQTLHQVLDKLERGDVVVHKLTIPEGLTLAETADLVETAGFGSARAVLNEARRVQLIADLDAQAKDLEGYLFPDTYFFARGTAEERIVQEMVERFREEITPQRLARMKDLGLSVRDAVTLASLVEEEASVEDERARIAGVFVNRLKLGMLLQCDPTVVYSLQRDGRYRGTIYRSDLSYASPYNTYVSRGLPPGPICSPGARSLDAALNPAGTSDLYFVVSSPGRHEFSATIQAHERAVRRYRQELDTARQPR